MIEIGHVAAADDALETAILFRYDINVVGTGNLREGQTRCKQDKRTGEAVERA